MKNYALFQPFWLSFFSRDVYRDVAQNWKGINALYVFVLLAIVLIPDMFALNSRIEIFLRDDGPQIVEQVPKIVIKAGVATVEEVDQPHIIRDPDTDRTIAIIDTTGTIISLENQEAKVLLTKRELIVRDKFDKESSYDLTGFGDMEFSKADAQGMLNFISRWSVYAIYPIFLFLSFMFRLSQAFLYGAVGLLFCRNLKVDLKYQQLVRLATLALTPVIIFAAVLDLYGTVFLFEGVIFFGITLFYLYFGVKANTEVPARTLG